MGECGVWTIERTWKIQPHYLDCGGDLAVYHESLTTRQVQVITVRDVRAPDYTSTPDAAVEIPFFANWRDANSMPLTDEVAHADMLALGLVSYPTTTVSVDGPFVEAPTGVADEATCRTRGLASFTRTQTHAVLRRSTTQNLPPDPVFVHLKYNAADRPNMRWTQRNARCAGINENQLPATRGAFWRALLRVFGVQSFPQF